MINLVSMITRYYGIWGSELCRGVLKSMVLCVDFRMRLWWSASLGHQPWCHFTVQLLIRFSSCLVVQEGPRTSFGYS